MSYNVLAPNFPFHKSTKWVVAFLKALKWIAKGSTFILFLNKSLLLLIMCCRAAKITFSSAVLLNLKINCSFQTQREFPFSDVSKTVSDEENIEVSCLGEGGESLKILP